MNGRLEAQMKSELSMKLKLKSYPEEVKDYYNYLLNTKEYKTASAYVSVVMKFMDSLKGKDLSKINLIDVNNYMQTVRMIYKNNELKRASDAWYNYNHLALKNFCSYLYQADIKNKNIMRDTKMSANHDDVKKVEVTTDDLKIMLNNAKNGVGTEKQKAYMASMRDRDVLIVYLLMTTGIRREALVEINMDDIDWDNREIKITDKRRKTFTISLGDATIEALNKWMETRKAFLGNQNCNALFISQRKNRLSANALYDLIRKLSEGTGKKISPHKLRAAYGTTVYNATGDIVATSRAMGHANIQTTQRYIVRQDSARSNATNIMESLLNTG